LNRIDDGLFQLVQVVVLPGVSREIVFVVALPTIEVGFNPIASRDEAASQCDVGNA
jgi:hypothetical protein